MTEHTTPRRIVQIATQHETTMEFARRYALADDGSLWMLMEPDPMQDDDSWERMPNLPNETEA